MNNHPSRPSSSRPKSTKPFSRRKSKSIKYLFTPEEMYLIDKRELGFGIEGYEIPKKHFDYHQARWHKKRANILSSHKRRWPPLDWPTDKNDDQKKVPPKRKTYLDDLYKWAYSYYDKNKAERLIEEKGIKTEDYVKPKVIDKIRRKNFLENEKKMKEYFKNKQRFPEHHRDAYEAAEEKVKDDIANKPDPMKLLIKHYKLKPQTARCDRVSVMSEAIYVGEQIPFYNTPPDEDGNIDKKHLFFPKKDYTWHRAPVWSYPLPKKNTENLEFVSNAAKEKYNNYLEEKGITPKNLWLDVIKSFHNVTHHGENLMRICKPFNYKEEDQYKTFLENNPRVYIGPQQYWKLPKEKPGKKVKENLSAITDDKGNKVYYMDRKKTDKRVYSAGMRKAVY